MALPPLPASGLWSPALQELVDATRDDRERVDLMNRAWKMYRGEHDRPLRVRGVVDDNVIVNVCRVIVDKGVSFLMGDDVAFEPGGERPDERVADAIDTLWQPWVNRRKSLLHRLAQTGAVTGTAAVKLNIPPGSPAGTPPRLTVIDPTHLRVFWDDADYERVVEYVIEWTAVDQRAGRATARRQRIADQGGSWLIVDEESRGDSARWREVSRVVWPYVWPPVVTCQNLVAAGEWWGSPDLTADIIDANNAVNRVLSNTARIIRFHAHPKTYVVGASLDSVDVAVDGTLELPEGATIGTVEMKGDLASSARVYEQVKQALHEVARVPEIAVGRLDNVGNLSGLALKILYGPLIEKTATKQMLYGELLADVVGRAAAVMGVTDPDAPTPQVVVTWPDPLPTDDKGDADAAAAKQAAGVSKRTTLMEMGYDPDVEAEYREVEQAADRDAFEAAVDRELNAEVE